MPLTYTTDKPVGTAPLARAVDCVGIQIRMPRKGERTVTFYFESTDSQGNLVEARPLHVPINDPELTSDPDYARLYSALKRIAYKLAPKAGYPTGVVR